MTDFYDAARSPGQFGMDQLDMQMKQAQMQQIQSLNAYRAQETQKQNLANQQMQKQLQVLSQAYPEGQSPGERVQSMADNLIKAGLPAQGLTLLGKVADVAVKDQNVKSAAALESKRMFDLQKARADRIINTLGAGMESPEAFEAMKAQLVEMGEKIPPGLQQYNPALLQRLMDAGMTARDRITQQHNVNMEKLKQAELKDKEVGRAAAMDRIYERSRMRREEHAERLKALGEQGPKGLIGIPDDSTIAAAEAMVSKEFPGLDASIQRGKDKLSTEAAYNIAADAKELMQRERISQQEALQRAFNDAKQNGDLALIEKGGFFSKGKSEYSRKGAAPDSAIAFKPGMKLVPGRYYNTNMGVVRATSPTTVVKADAGSRAPAAPPASPVRSGSAVPVGGDDGEDEGDE